MIGQTMKKTAKLPGPKVCPWCGRTPYIEFTNMGQGLYDVTCENDKCAIQPRAMYNSTSRRDAIAIWNKRTKRK